MIKEIREETCPACGHHLAVKFLESQDQPLATLAWPTDKKTAQGLQHLPLDFIRCIQCGHIFNAEFEYNKVPYSDNPNLMFNKGDIWSDFIAVIQKKIMSYLPDDPMVIEIGHGDGSFLESLQSHCGNGRFIGFDPHGMKQNNDNLDRSIIYRNELFEPIRHLSELKPDLIISRHVLEHLVNPLGFLQSLSFAANYYNLSPYTYFEVPCIDKVLETGRTVDFYYEHSSQFTSQSFDEMLNQSTLSIDEIGYGYDKEVIYSFCKVYKADFSDKKVTEARNFYKNTKESLENIKNQIQEIYVSGKKVAVWGGTGKSCAFMCRYGIDDIRFPIVVDSDISKVGTYVPGTGQEIKFRNCLIDEPVEIIIIPPQWRARDIIAEIEINNISYNQILIEHNGALIDFNKEDHPY